MPNNTATSLKNLTPKYSMLQSSYWMSSCCIMCFASVFLISRGFTNTEIGITLAIANALSILCQPFVAAFADKTKKLSLRSIMAILIALTLVVSVLLFITPSVIIPTAVLYIFLLAFQNMQQPLLTSLAMEHINSGGTLNFSLARGIGSLSFAVVSLGLGFLVDGFGGSIIIILNAVFSLICMLLVMRFNQPSKAAQAEHGKEEASSGFVVFICMNKRFILTVLCLVLMFFSHVLINTYTIRIVENVGGSNSDMGIASAIGGLIELPAMVAFPFILKKLKSAGLILKLSALFMVVKALATILAPNVYWFYFAQCFQFLSFAMYLPASVYYVNRMIKRADRVKGQMFIGLGMSISGMLGNIFGGMLIDNYGITYTLIVGMIVSFIGFIALSFVAPKDKEET